LRQTGKILRIYCDAGTRFCGADCETIATSGQGGCIERNHPPKDQTMHSTTRKFYSQPRVKKNIAGPRTSIIIRALNWLAERDRGYREAIKLRQMPKERLDDMGITRKQANTAYYKRFANRAPDQSPPVLTTLG